MLVRCAGIPRQRGQTAAIRGLESDGNSVALSCRPTSSIGPLPPKCPELNPVENIWEFMRGNWLSSRVFKSLNRTMISSIAAAPPGTNCRSALADHVHSSAPMGARVLINETCYNISASMLDQLG